ncbi:MAG: molybdopterin-guanine dinucleotide biosynthesis protein B [Candidatus Helarchaeota archaeon]
MLTKYFSIVGFSNTGKTTIIVDIIKYLVNKGYIVGVCKYIHHRGFGIDVPDKDTTKFYENGAKIVSYISPDASGIINVEKNGINQTFRNIENKVDYLILEGFRKFTGVPKLVLIKEESDMDSLIDDFTIGVTSHLVDVSNHKLYIKQEDIPEFVEKKALAPMSSLNCLKCGYKSCRDFYMALLKGKEDSSKCVLQVRNVELYINDKLILINPFVEDIFQKVLLGIVQTLQKPNEKVNSIKINIRNIQKN